MSRNFAASLTGQFPGVRKESPVDLRKSLGRVSAVVGSAVALSMSAILPAAAAFTVPPEIAEAGTNAGLVGTAVFAVIVGIKAFKWMRRAL